MKDDLRNGAGPSAEMTLEGAYDHCWKAALGSASACPRALRFCAKPARRHAAAVTAFCALADEAAALPGAAAREGVADLADQLGRVGRAPARHPVFLALERTLAETGLERALFERVLEGARRECGAARFADHESLREHCARLVHPRARALLAIHGYRDAQILALAEEAASGAWFAHRLARVAADLGRDRIYFPEADLRECGYSEADLRMGVVNERFRALVKLQWKRARAHFEAGRPLSRRVSWPLSWQARLGWLEGTLLLRKLREADFDALRRPPRVGARDWPGVIFWLLAAR